MTIHDNTTEQQYHHAPVEGLAVGAITGTVWDTVFVMSYVNSQKAIDPKEYPSLFTMSLIFPLIGWLTGLWERKMYACDDSKKRRLKTKIIGAAMATFAGILMFSTEFFLFADHISFNSVEAAVHPLPLAVFPCAGLALSDIGIRLKNSKSPFILSMSIASVIILFITVAVWFYVFSITELSLSSHS